MRASVALLLLASCVGRVEPECLAPPSGSYEAALTVVETNCPGSRPGDVSTGRVDLDPAACSVVDCTMVCDQGPSETIWTATGPDTARVTFSGTCRVLYDAQLARVESR